MARKPFERVGIVGGAGGRLREERERLGISLSAFAEKVGVHRNTQTNYELGKREFDQAYVMAVKGLGVDLPYLLDGMKSEEVVEIETRMDLAKAVLASLGYPDEGPTGLNGIVSALISMHELSPGGDSDIYENRLLAIASTLVNASPVIQGGGGLDSALLASVIEGVEDAALSGGQTIQPARKAQAITMLYRAFRSSGKIDPAMIRDAVRLAA